MILKINKNTKKYGAASNYIILNDDVINIINDFIKIKCHVCKKRYKIERNFYKKQKKFYYCSKICYEFT